MKLLIRRVAPFATVVLTVLTALLRLCTISAVQQEAVGEFGISFWLIIGLSAAALLLAVLAWILPADDRPAVGDRRLSIGAATVVVGAALLLETLWSMVSILLTGETPPPNAQVLNTADLVSLWLTLVFGLLGGGWFLCRGIRALGGHPVVTAERFGGLFPVVWIWFRLVRYELSYASAMSVKHSFFDFFMLIFLMLFLLAFSRTCAQVTPPSVRWLRAVSAVAAITGLASPIARLGMHFLRDSQAYQTTQLAGLTDFAIGLLALVFTFALYRENETVQTAPTAPAAPPAPKADITTPTADRLLDEWLQPPTDK